MLYRKSIRNLADHTEWPDDHVVSLEADGDGEVDGAGEAHVSQGQHHRDQLHIPVGVLTLKSKNV